MTTWLLGIALLLVVTIALGLVRVLLGPTAADRLLATQLLGTTGVAILLLLSFAQDAPALRDVALVLAVLAVVTSSAFSRHAPGSPGR